jgi:hypothetical protein
MEGCMYQPWNRRSIEIRAIYWRGKIEVKFNCYLIDWKIKSYRVEKINLRNNEKRKSWWNKIKKLRDG